MENRVSKNKIGKSDREESTNPELNVKCEKSMQSEESEIFTA